MTLDQQQKAAPGSAGSLTRVVGGASNHNHVIMGSCLPFRVGVLDAQRRVRDVALLVWSDTPIVPGYSQDESAVQP